MTRTMVELIGKSEQVQGTLYIVRVKQAGRKLLFLSLGRRATVLVLFSHSLTAWLSVFHFLFLTLLLVH